MKYTYQHNSTCHREMIPWISTHVSIVFCSVITKVWRQLYTSQSHVSANMSPCSLDFDRLQHWLKCCQPKKRTYTQLYMSWAHVSANINPCFHCFLLGINQSMRTTLHVVGQCFCEYRPMFPWLWSPTALVKRLSAQKEDVHPTLHVMGSCFCEYHPMFPLTLVTHTTVLSARNKPTSSTAHVMIPRIWSYVTFHSLEKWQVHSSPTIGLSMYVASI